MNGIRGLKLRLMSPREVGAAVLRTEYSQVVLRIRIGAITAANLTGSLRSSAQYFNGIVC